MGSSIVTTKDNKVALPDLDTSNIFLSPDSVLSSPGSIALQGSYRNNITQNGIPAESLSKILNSVMDYSTGTNNAIINVAESMSNKMTDGVNTATDKMSVGMTSAMEILGNKLSETQQGETGQFEKLIKQFGIFIIVGLAVFGLLIKGKK